MGYSLVFYSLDWNTLCNELTSQRPQRMASIRQSQWEKLQREQSPEEVEASWIRACKEISSNLTPGILRPSTPVTLDTDAALLFVAQVQHLGVNLGELDHASASGEEFLGEFLGNVAATFFEVPNLTERLTNRPICGLRSEMFPCWGGIRQGELIELVNCIQRKQQELPEGSEDSAIWLEELSLILQDGVSTQRDIVTLYL